MKVENWTSRILVNALIGFSRADPAWPNPLGECGWRVSTIEPDWLVDVAGTQQPARIRPDVVFALRAGEELLLVECKVGTVQQDQLQRYLLVTTNRIREQSVERPVNAVQVAYAGTDPHRQSCEQSLSGTDIPLLNFSDDEALLVLGSLNEPCADGRFRAGVALAGRPPTQYIPLDSDSPLEEAIPVVLRALMGLALDDVHQFDVRTVVERVFGDMFQALSSSFRSDLRHPVERALTRLSTATAIGDVLSSSGGGVWALRPNFGQSGGLQFRTAARRITEQLTVLAQQQSLDV